MSVCNLCTVQKSMGLDVERKSSKPVQCRLKKLVLGATGKPNNVCSGKALPRVFISINNAFVRFADALSIAVTSRRSDLEILGYVMLQWLCDRLPLGKQS
ncbi:Serine/threonine-protein kinase vrk1 [Desmophyllum pertusum]|uniref:Serine/threonine-protein kinase vrk1 n=1 Tax=Desmophyllum pertusum TaxID=174260 RepID=A0A9W9Z384_9CNID|nr:Serine/threonine-protein kinase vrk1 [Desmophyllum pertusum]